MVSRYAENTSVSVEKSKAEIERILQRWGADAFSYATDQGRAVVQFRMAGKIVRLQLTMPERSDEQFQYTPSRGYRREPDAAYKAWEQACRQWWWALALVIKAKLEAIETGITSFEEEFLSFIVLPDNSTVAQFMIPQVTMIGLATTTLRAVIGEIALDEVLSQRERINNLIRDKLDTETERWGIKVTNVEIREIEPPRDIQESMNRQMTAERVRRAVVTEAEGTREAAVTVAEGDKAAAILQAEGQRQAEILSAEGDQQAAVLRAEGFSTALDRIFSIAQNIDSNTLSLQYFETLKQLGSSPSTKFIFPMEFTNLLAPFTRMAGGANGSDPNERA